MKRLYSVHEACALFSIDASTLRRWRAALSIVPLVDPTHHSRRLYTVADVVALAQAHRRFALLSSLVSCAAAETLDQSALTRSSPPLLCDIERRLRQVELRLSELYADSALLTEMSGKYMVSGDGSCTDCDEQGRCGYCLDCGACDGDAEKM